MKSHFNPIVFCAACLLAMLSGRLVRADYVFALGEFLSPHRVHDNGADVRVYTPSGDALNLVESYGSDYAVTPDRKTVYGFTNSLGFSDYVFAFDVATGQYLPDKSLHLTFSGGFPTKLDSYLISPQMSLIRPSDPFGLGDLFGTNPTTLPSTPDAFSSELIKRVNRSTSLVTEAIRPPTPQAIYDFAFGSDNRLYMAAHDGIFVFAESPSGFSLVSPTPLIGSVTGNFTVGPDGKLYVRNGVTGSIDRYTTAGEFVDTFIPASSIPEAVSGPARGSIQFGVDGNLHINIHPGGHGNFGDLYASIGKYDGATGSLISLLNSYVPNYYVAPLGRINYLPVPEPSSILLAILGATALCLRRSIR